MDTQALLQTVEHRPFPLPAGPWIMTQIWRELLFAHWPFAPAVLRSLVPRMLDLDTFDGQCWVSLTPFRMAGVRPRAVPPFPGLSYFPEMNLRTYVIVGGLPGIYFFSLDAGNRIAVALARWLFHLPYFHARMRCVRRGDGLLYYECHRLPKNGPEAHVVARYRPISPVTYAQRGTLDYWLAERYCLYSIDRRNHVYRGNIHHLPWPLQHAELSMVCKQIELPHGIELPERPVLLRYAQRQDVLVWPLQRIL